MSEKRFIEIFKQGDGFNGRVRILQDRMTGVCYLQTTTGYGGGITPLLGPDGRPVVQPVAEGLGR